MSLLPMQCRAVVKWNMFYFLSNGFSLLINCAWLFKFQNPTPGERAFQELPPHRSSKRPTGRRSASAVVVAAWGLLHGIRVNVQAGTVIRVHTFMKYGSGI